MLFSPSIQTVVVGSRRFFSPDANQHQTYPLFGIGFSIIDPEIPPKVTFHEEKMGHRGVLMSKIRSVALFFTELEIYDRKCFKNFEPLRREWVPMLYHVVNICPPQKILRIITKKIRWHQRRCIGPNLFF